MEATEFFEDDEPHCFICCLTAASNVTGDVEPLLVCRDCSTKGESSSKAMVTLLNHDGRQSEACCLLV